jgi:asparagine synthase (glutamine-hydrolysing)
MPRIAGIVSPRGKKVLTLLVNQMLAQLPGRNTSFQCTPELSFGSKDQKVLRTEKFLCLIDGQIFNWKELALEFPTPATTSSLVLILTLFQRYGFERTLNKLYGDFAIALYDITEQKLWLGRDRLGVKPLYFAKIQEGFAFASQPWALLVHNEVSSNLNRRFVASFAGLHYRTFDNRPDESPYANIGQLPAGSILCFQKGSVTVKRYWQIKALPNFEQSHVELAGHLREHLLDAVKLRIKSDSKNAFTLSGGLDSSSVTACAQTITKEAQTAYSAVYEDKTFDESDEIQPMLEEKVSDWNPILINDEIDLFAEVTNLVSHHNEPVATATWLSHNYVCKAAARDGQTLLFGGLGSDELNAGEYEYFIYYFADLARNGLTDVLETELESWAHYHDHPLYRKSAKLGRNEIKRLTNDREGICLPDNWRLKRYIHVLDQSYYSDELMEIRMDHPFDSCLKNRTFQDLFFETLPCCLRAEDRNATAAGISHANPFLDHRLVEFMFRIDGRNKIRSGVTKILLREAMRGILPEKTRTRINKIGWNAPAHKWFSAIQLERLRDMVSSQEFSDSCIYNASEVHALIQEHKEILSGTSPRENHMMFLWQLLNLHIWIDASKKIKGKIQRAPANAISSLDSY